MSTKRRSFSAGLFYGQLVGLAYFVSTLIFFWPREELFLLRKAPGKIHLFLNSLSFWVIVFGLFTAVLFGIAGLVERKKPGFIREALSTSVLLFVALAGYAVYIHYDYNTPPHYPFYLLKGEFVHIVLIVLAISVLGGVIGHFKLKLWRKIIKYQERLGSSMPKLYKLSVVTFAFLFLYFLTSAAVSSISKPGGKDAAGTEAKNVYVLGLDGASWNILVPLLKDGGLPNMAKMMDNSAYGHFTTYGEQFTPPVWASIATGMKREKHNINDFADSIHHLRTKPLWEILSDKGEKAGVVNWMNAYPAVDLNGFMLTNNQGKLDYTFSVKYPEDFELPPEELFLADKPTEDKNRLDSMMNRLTGELDNLKRTLELCRELDSYRAVLSYIYAIDGIQHYFWSDFKSAEKHAFLTSWKTIDSLIGDIAQIMGEDTYFLIMSDHGSRYINKPETVLDLEKILDILGVSTQAEDESAESPIRILNEELIAVSKEVSNRDFSTLVTELKNVRFAPSNKRIFRAVDIFDRKDRRLINLELTRHLKVKPKNPPGIRIQGKDYAYDDIVYPHPWSGRHRARGMLIVNGPHVKRKFLGAWIIDSPYSYLFRTMHGRINTLDKIYPLLKFFRFADPVTTLDVTPTLLTILGHPVARDMDGCDFSSSILSKSPGKALKPVKTYGLSRYFDESKKLDKDVTKKIKDEMRALGYIE